MIRMLGKDDIPKALDLAWQVFMEFEAPDYSKEGIRAFRSFLDCEAAIKALTFYGCYVDDELAGMLAMRGDSHICMLFVTGSFHKRGIGRALFDHALENSSAAEITVHSSPYAEGFYGRLGFAKTDVEQVRDGIRFIPMSLRR
ncbi:MAG TPA: GNAT family N-acetyltransferase [Bacillota bacterium]|nr:MAG: putative acetyltransferase [Firmicutes bacterium ADurb.Bin153]HNV35036.1 GNAT family N-acetyltransferase [Bacillota bacterium]HPU95868.1 GNAT family N-acetyltransferase [Bacillota bacterium]